MKLKNSYFYTLRENPKDEDSTSSSLLTKSGMIKRTSAGIYMFLPLGYKVLKNIENIIRDEMNKKGGQELVMPTLILEDVYEKSGRRDSFGSNMFGLKDRYEKNYVLGPTHEELFTVAAMMNVKSYKDLPFNIYQFQNKFRDETRPRYGLIRTREFIMKDAYSFDTSLEGLDKSYNQMAEAYNNMFDRMKLTYKVVKADTGAMGGLLSEEYQALTTIGEDTVVLCDSCSFASNIEVAPTVNKPIEVEKHLEKELVSTPNAKTIKEVSSFLGKKEENFVKTLIYKIDNELYAVLVNGEDEVNETKLKKLLNKNEIELASGDEVEEATTAKIGFAGPIGLNIKIVVDNKVLNMHNFIIGANKTDYHYKNVNLEDFKYEIASDIRNIKENDICPKCGGNIYFQKGIEVGNIFKIGTKYSEALGLEFLDQDNKLNSVHMGCYGIGIARCMATIVEQHNDEKGIIWPIEVAPYKVAIVLIDNKDEKQSTIANAIYDRLTEMKIDVILDDRDVTPGVKFNDMDLIGIPVRITVGKKVNEDKVELKLRTEKDFTDLEIKDVINTIIEKLK